VKSTLRRCAAQAIPITFAVLAFAPHAARACGVSTADGLSACSLAEHEEETRPRWRAGASAAYTSTAINFGSGLSSAPETRGSVTASLAYQPTPRLTWQLAAGSTVGGHVTTPTGTYDFSPGPTGAVGASYRLVRGTKPFVLLTANLSFSATTTQLAGNAMNPKVSYDAFDLRAGGLVGTTLFGVLSPYAVVRAFGGPIYWKYQGTSVTGTDAHHYQVGAGLTLVIAGRVDAFVEGVPLGERSLAAGAAFAF
jgi:hypothetical protein